MAEKYLIEVVIPSHDSVRWQLGARGLHLFWADNSCVFHLPTDADVERMSVEQQQDRITISVTKSES